jgi:hypothetical protein
MYRKIRNSYEIAKDVICGLFYLDIPSESEQRRQRKESARRIALSFSNNYEGPNLERRVGISNFLTKEEIRAHWDEVKDYEF